MTRVHGRDGPIRLMSTLKGKEGPRLKTLALYLMNENIEDPSFLRLRPTAPSNGTNSPTSSSGARGSNSYTSSRAASGSFRQRGQSGRLTPRPRPAPSWAWCCIIACLRVSTASANTTKNRTHMLQAFLLTYSSTALRGDSYAFERDGPPVNPPCCEDSIPKRLRSIRYFIPRFTVLGF